MFTPTEEKKIVKAIQKAEANTSGELRVHITQQEVEDSFLHAQEIFIQLNMHETQLRNAVLIHISLKSRNFTLLGDVGIHQKVGSEFWEKTKEKMMTCFNQRAIVEGICIGIDEIGKVLHQHFPVNGSINTNELSDEITYD